MLATRTEQVGANRARDHNWRPKTQEQKMENLKPGIYRHYKGNDYEVIGCARHSETEEWMVVYRTLYGDFSLWVRPLGMFTEEVVLDSGERVARFAPL